MCEKVKTERVLKSVTEKSVICCHFHQRFRANFEVNDGQKRLKLWLFKCNKESCSVDRWKQNEHASVVESLLLRFHRIENEDF